MHVRMIRAALAALALCCCGPAFAQVAQFQAFVVTTCGSVTLPTGAPRTPYMDQNGILCTTAGAGGGGGGATGSVGPAGTNGTAAQSVQGINGGVNVGVSATSWPLPTGAATAANQSTANGSLASIDGKTPALVNGNQPVLPRPVTGSLELDTPFQATLDTATTGNAIVIPTSGMATAGFAFPDLAASGGAVLAYDQSNDWTTTNASPTWTAVNECNTLTGVPSNTRSTNGNVRVPLAGHGAIRVRVQTAGTQTVKVNYGLSVRQSPAERCVPVPPGGNRIGSVGIDQTTPGSTNLVANQGYDGTTWRNLRTTTTGALEPPTADTGKIVSTSTTLTANTSTQLVGTGPNRIAMEIQCDGTAVVGISRTGAALTSATAAPLVIPAGSYPLYTMPIVTLTAVTAYTGTGQVCRVTEYLR